MSYKIVRMFYASGLRKRTIKTGLTLKEAQKHCQDSETSSRTCKTARAKAITKKHGPWFDGYEEV